MAKVCWQNKTPNARIMQSVATSVLKKSFFRTKKMFEKNLFEKKLFEKNMFDEKMLKLVRWKYQMSFLSSFLFIQDS
jgi:hypothetical protein